MVKKFFMVSGLILLALVSCATSGGSGDSVSLNEAIEQSAEKITTDLPKGSRVAIVAWESPSAGLSDYIMEELTAAILILATIIVDEVFSPDKNQKVTPGFMQGIAQSCLHMVKKHISPPKSGPRFPVFHITKFQYRVKLKCQQI